MRPFIAGLIAASTLALSGCGYNPIQTQDEAVKAAWSDVVNQYPRRADLIPNLVATVKGYAAHEQSVLVGVTEARARDIPVFGLDSMQQQLDAFIAMPRPAALAMLRELLGSPEGASRELRGIIDAYGSAEAERELTTLVPVPSAPAHWVRPGYGLGIMGDAGSRWGMLWGHNGGGPGYTTSAFHAPRLGGVSVCAMCASRTRREPSRSSSRRSTRSRARRAAAAC